MTLCHATLPSIPSYLPLPPSLSPPLHSPSTTLTIPLSPRHPPLHPHIFPSLLPFFPPPNESSLPTHTTKHPFPPLPRHAAPLSLSLYKQHTFTTHTFSTLVLAFIRVTSSDASRNGTRDKYLRTAGSLPAQILMTSHTCNYIHSPAQMCAFFLFSFWCV